MPSRTRFVPLACLLLLAARLLACSSSTGSGGGHGGSGSTGGTGGTEGDPLTCDDETPCPVGQSTCVGNAVATPTIPCDPTTLTCTGQPETVMTPCPEGAVCSGGRCLARVTPPTQACTTASDCGLPPTVCVDDTNQLVYSDPSCDEGQCHWKQMALSCGDWGVDCDIPSGQCVAEPVEETVGPADPNPTSPNVPPSTPPPQACTTAADCKQPAPTCFSSAVVSYVDAACEMGSCVWEMSFSECPRACFDGACADVACHADADCPPWPATCHETYPQSGAWFVEACAAPTCLNGACECTATTTSCAEGKTCSDGACSP